MLRFLLMIALCPVLAVAAPGEAPEAAPFVVVAGDTIWMVRPLEVVGSRVPVALPGVVRTMDVILTEEAEQAAARSVGELLQTVPGVVVSQRQQYGVQADLTLRGSTFDQVQVLLNGFDVGDPQTGHHALDLPVGKADVARLEVLPGHGSSLYGPGAFGGTVNVVTRDPAGRNGGRVAVTGGPDGLWRADASGDLRLGPDTGSRFSLERFRIDGQFPGDDADTWTGTGRLVHEGSGTWDVFGGYSDRQYGAQDFYAPFDSYEKTRTLFVSSLYRTDVSPRLTLEPRVYYRRHRDEFILFRDNPNAYTNDHVARKTGAELRGVVDLGAGHALAVSTEATYDDIDSRGLRGGQWGEALGFHARRRLSLAAELKRNRGPWRWQMGGRIDRQTGDHARWSGSGAVSWEVSQLLTARASVGSVYRVPTYTDLYYYDPANAGNPDLVPETGWAWDTGLEANQGPWQGRLTFFERRENNLIEWARPLGETIWHALNIAEGTTRGAEFSAGWRHGAGHRLGVGWSRVSKQTSQAAGFEGKYTLLVPRQVITGQILVALSRRVSWTVNGRFVEHTGGPAEFARFFVVDSRVSWAVAAGWTVSLAGTNLTDREYAEVPGVQMPGTVVTGTMGYGF